MNWSTIFPILISGLGPTIVAIANNIHQRKLNEQNNDFQIELANQNTKNQIKLKQFEFNQNAKVQAINNYLENLTNCINNVNDENLTKLKLSASKLFLYVSSHTRQEITNVLNVIGDETLTDNLKEVLEENLELFLHSLKDEASQS